MGKKELSNYDDFLYMSNRYYTFMMVPERGDKVRKISVPAWYLRIVLTGAALLILIGLFIFFDYLHVISQVAENKKLKVENHLIRRELLGVQNKIESLDKTVGRLKSFAQKLRFISDIEQGNGNQGEGAPPQSGPNTDTPTKGKKAAPNSAPNENPDLYEEESPVDENAQVEPEIKVQAEVRPHQDLDNIIGDFEERLDANNLVVMMNDLYSTASQLENVTLSEEKTYAYLLEYFKDRVDRMRFTPSLLPADGRLSSEFGFRYNPFTGVRTFHNGLDIANRIGTTVYAPADGVVRVTGVMGALGKTIRIDHGYNIVTKYGHLSQIYVELGQKIKRGDKIALMGTSGRSTGPHLHYQVEINRKPVNPRVFILNENF
jgi:murein DD-endopeptidase MepM/ murein hydrolase activator NlpD